MCNKRLSRRVLIFRGGLSVPGGVIADVNVFPQDFSGETTLGRDSMPMVLDPCEADTLPGDEAPDTVRELESWGATDPGSGL